MKDEDRQNMANASVTEQQERALIELVYAASLQERRDVS